MSDVEWSKLTTRELISDSADAGKDNTDIYTAYELGVQEARGRSLIELMKVNAAVQLKISEELLRRLNSDVPLHRYGPGQTT